jgi:hypothetical protein
LFMAISLYQRRSGAFAHTVVMQALSCSHLDQPS